MENTVEALWGVANASVDGADLGARQAQDPAHGAAAPAAHVQDARVGADARGRQAPPVQGGVPQVHGPERESADQR